MPSPAEDQFALTPARITTLTTQLRYPTTYNQRCVEHLTFLDDGGQRWERHLQVRIPESSIPAEHSWRIVSLGTFKRRRFPDFAVEDAVGRRLNLVTRHEHGTVLTQSLIAKHFREFPTAFEKIRKATAPDAREAYDALRTALYFILTSVESESDEITEASQRASRAFTTLLRGVGCRPGEETTARVQVFADDFRQILRVTEYLCWVAAEAGDVLSLRVSHTSEDVEHELAPLKSLADALGVIWSGVAEPRSTRRSVHADWYVQYGLAPVKYEFTIPSHDHAGSYYFTLAPPARSYVAYLDWETGNWSAERGRELDSAYPGMHVHNDRRSDDEIGEDTEPTAAGGRTIRAYVRCAPNEHKKIAAGALLNGVFAFLVAYGHFTGASNQDWLVVTPTILMAYLAQQQRHYFAHATRRQRAVVWLYVALSVLFLVTIAFNRSELAAGSEKWGWFTLIVAWLFATGSAALFAWYAPLGYSFQRITERRTHHVLEKGENSYAAWETYEWVIQRYCRRIMRFVTIMAIATTVAAALTWHHPKLM